MWLSLMRRRKINKKSKIKLFSKIKCNSCGRLPNPCSWLHLTFTLASSCRQKKSSIYNGLIISIQDDLLYNRAFLNSFWILYQKLYFYKIKTFANKRSIFTVHLFIIIHGMNRLSIIEFFQGIATPSSGQKFESEASFSSKQIFTSSGGYRSLKLRKKSLNELIILFLNSRANSRSDVNYKHKLLTNGVWIPTEQNISFYNWFEEILDPRGIPGGMIGIARFIYSVRLKPIRMFLGFKIQLRVLI